jgi:hypothetical protein
MILRPAALQDAFYYAVHATRHHAFAGYESQFYNLHRGRQELNRTDALERSLRAAREGGYDGPLFSHVSSVMKRAEMLVHAFLAWGPQHQVDMPAGTWIAGSDQWREERERKEREQESIPGKMKRLDVIVTSLAAGTPSHDPSFPNVWTSGEAMDVTGYVRRSVGDPEFRALLERNAPQYRSIVLQWYRNALDYFIAGYEFPIKLPTSREKTMDDLVDVIAYLESLPR